MSDIEPIVSVIVPTFNCELYVSETLDSVLSQTYKNIELLAVDDGSTDRTREIIASYGSGVKLLTQQNARVCAARNRGIAESTGQYICLLDHDDYWYPDKLEKQVRALQTNPETGVVYSTFIPWHRDAGSGAFPDPASIDLSAWADDIDPEFSGWIYHQFLLNCWMLTSSAMFRREVFQKCGVFDVSLPYSEDWELWLRISREFPFLKLRRPTTLYRQHPQQGNRLARDVDYRTQLMTETAKKWGRCSRDGRCVSERQFKQRLARYHAEFGLGHLGEGNVRFAIPALFEAWCAQPTQLKYLAYIPAAALGWRPNW